MYISSIQNIDHILQWIIAFAKKWILCIVFLHSTHDYLVSCYAVIYFFFITETSINCHSLLFESKSAVMVLIIDLCMVHGRKHRELWDTHNLPEDPVINGSSTILGIYLYMHR